MKFLGPSQSGSSQGDTSSRSRFGQYYRSRRTPVNPNSQPQSLARARLATASQAWRGLSEAVRRAWSAAAAEVPRQDAIGQTVYQTGAQMFIGSYTSMLQAGLAVPPAVPSVSPPAAPVITNLPVAATSTFNVYLAVAPTASLVAVIDVVPMVSAGVSFVADYRFLLAATSLTGGLIPIGATYAARFGNLITGKKVFVRVRYVTATGGVSTPAFASAIVG